MKIRKTKKGNSIRRIVAFLLCMTMVLGLGMQDVMEQVYAEGTPVTVQEGTAQDTEKITEGEQTGDEPAAPEETTPPTEETENEGSTGDTSGDGVQDEPDAGQPGEDTNTGESGGDNTGDTGTETQPGDGSTDTSGEEGNVDTPGEGEGQGTEEGDVTVPTVPEGEEGQKPVEGDATAPEGEEGQKPGEGDAAASEDTEQADAPEEEEPAEGVAFEDSYTDEKVTIQVSAEAGVIPEGAVLSVTPIEKTEPDESMSDEEKAEAEKINAQYDLTEKKLTEESDENGEVMEGFLAYDISFLVTNEDGETQSEVEPAGEVKVVMDFNEAAVPEGVSENAEVSVKHLKEDETAEDGIVVEDVTENAVVTAAETGIPAVEKVELTAESFSTYTITWRRTDELEIHIVDFSGNDLISTDEEYSRFDWKDQNRISVNEILKRIQNEYDFDLENSFVKAVYVEASKEFDSSAVQIYGFLYKESDFWYCKDSDFAESNTGWNPVGDGKVYFIFGEEPEISTDPIETVSTKDTITINVFDYVVGEDGDESADWNSREGINEGHVLKFVDEKGEDNKNININQDGSRGYINSGMVQLVLTNDFPVLSGRGNTQQESLEYLFKPETEEEDARNDVRNQYLGLDHLFSRDGRGYLVFNSNDSYAYLESYGEGNFAQDFTVIGYDGSVSSKGFFPFTQPTAGNFNDLKNSQNDAVLGHDGVNHYYGMTIEAGFIQPKGGIIDNAPMEFKFSGDDDVWVFIDDVLVLDLGGIHGAVSGTINFKTGEVTTQDIGESSEKHVTTIKEAFGKADKDDSSDFSGNTFADYTSHTIKFFYLERGNTDSNCKIEFNFPTIPADSVTVAKEVVGGDGIGVDYAQDIDFRFQIKKAAAGENLAPFGNAEYKLYDENSHEIINTDGNGNPIPWAADENGYFTLKHGQMAVFEDFIATDHYEVIETGAYLDGYVVTIDDSTVEIDTGDGSETIYSASTGDRVAGNDHDAKFKNKIENITQLSITKKVADGVASDGPFAIKLWIQGVLYEGSYQLNGESGYNAADGVIELNKDDTITITGLPYGVTFEVEEILETNSPYKPTYGITGDVSGVQIPGAGNTYTKASAQIVGNDNNGAAVTITNSINPDYTIDLTVRKEWRGPEQDRENYDDVTVQLCRDDVAYRDPVKITEGNNWIYTFEDLPYYQEDGVTPCEYTVIETMIGTFPVVNTVGWLFIDYSKKSDGTLVITNSLPQSWFIQKVSSVGKTPLDGAIFTLTKEGESTPKYWGQSDVSESGDSMSDGRVVWWEENSDLGNPEKIVPYIPDGTYTLEEKEAPAGYMETGIIWKIVIENLTVKSITYTDANGGEHQVEPVSLQTRGSYNPIVYQYENEVELYELPSTGGPGIHLYMLGGTLLMMAGALLVYKKRKEEVLRS